MKKFSDRAGPQRHARAEAGSSAVGGVRPVRSDEPQTTWKKAEAIVNIIMPRSP
ncbi:hypothetical protein [Nannocystis exedens]|uniref:hypothetical protein n=1 Tax=Nannocystis exedens TaxID=54 RepID=UPI001476402B|nr:hypothetical protein [Nannocystis exedens]